ncbi:MFS transporter [Gluconacetobacter sacchari]|uniref:MFS transporter n=1 Tax=Gluconacetobacter sacchari TaxID=92759 RepID=A0A7W4ID38_9PROT|nr:hypothetical protein [Gluconacetobacter sacchari]MBB2160659.1 hypothetical protein [Gluconacetobacter sacchari]
MLCDFLLADHHSTLKSIDAEIGNAVNKDRNGIIPVGTAFALDGAVMGVWSSELPRIKIALSMSNLQTTVILTALVVGTIISVILRGTLLSRVDYRRIMGTSTLIQVILLTVTVNSNKIFVLFVFTMLLGMFRGFTEVIINQKSLFLETKVGKPINSYFHALYSIFGFAASISLSTIGNLYFSEQSSSYILEACLVLGSASLFLIEAQANLDIRHTNEVAHASTSINRVGSMLAWLGVTAFFAVMAECAVADWSGILFLTVHHIDARSAGIGYAAFSGGMAVGRLLGSHVSATIGDRWCVMIGSMAASGGLLAGVYGSQIIAICGLVLAGLGCANLAPILYRAAHRLSPRIGVGVVAGFGYSGLVAGPVIVGGITIATGSLPVAFALLCVVYAMVALLSRYVVPAG